MGAEWVTTSQRESGRRTGVAPGAARSPCGVPDLPATTADLQDLHQAEAVVKPIRCERCLDGRSLIEGYECGRCGRSG